MVLISCTEFTHQVIALPYLPSLPQAKGEKLQLTIFTACGRKGRPAQRSRGESTIRHTILECLYSKYKLSIIVCNPNLLSGLE